MYIVQELPITFYEGESLFDPLFCYLYRARSRNTCFVSSDKELRSQLFNQTISGEFEESTSTVFHYLDYPKLVSETA